MSDRQEPLEPVISRTGCEPTAAWFCLRAQPKHEHIAAGHLGQIEGIDVFNPRIRYTRSTRLGPANVTESMFPSYLFARFDRETQLNRVHYTRGVRGIVHFGSKWPTVPDAAIEELRRLIGNGGVHQMPHEIKAGDEIEVAQGAFHGLHAVVTQVMPGSQRVIVLMDFLGRQTTVELKSQSIIKRGLGR